MRTFPLNLACIALMTWRTYLLVIDMQQKKIRCPQWEKVEERQRVHFIASTIQAMKNDDSRLMVQLFTSASILSSDPVDAQLASIIQL